MAHRDDDALADRGDGELVFVEAHVVEGVEAAVDLVEERVAVSHHLLVEGGAGLRDEALGGVDERLVGVGVLNELLGRRGADIQLHHAVCRWFHL